MDIIRQHEMFQETQAKLATRHFKRRQDPELATVSSKLSVEDDTSSQSVRPGMEGKGPRTVPKIFVKS